MFKFLSKRFHQPGRHAIACLNSAKFRQFKAILINLIFPSMIPWQWRKQPDDVLCFIPEFFFIRYFYLLEIIIWHAPATREHVLSFKETTTTTKDDNEMICVCRAEVLCTPQSKRIRGFHNGLIVVCLIISCRSTHEFSGIVASNWVKHPSGNRHYRKSEFITTTTITGWTRDAKCVKKKSSKKCR